MTTKTAHPFDEIIARTMREAALVSAETNQRKRLIKFVSRIVITAGVLMMGAIFLVGGTVVYLYVTMEQKVYTDGSPSDNHDRTELSTAGEYYKAFGFISSYRIGGHSFDLEVAPGFQNTDLGRAIRVCDNLAGKLHGTWTVHTLGHQCVVSGDQAAAR
jgi:hypothetical protein